MSATASGNGTTPHVLTPVQLEAVAALAHGWPGTGNRNKANIALCGGLLRDRVTVPVTEALIAELARSVNDDYPRTDLVQRTQERLQAGEPTRGWPALGKILGERGAAPLRQFRRLLGLLCTLEDLAAHKQLPVAFLQDLGLHDLPDGGVGIPLQGRQWQDRRDQEAHAALRRHRQLVAQRQALDVLRRGASGGGRAQRRAPDPRRRRIR
jgi:hypothetical protein